MRILFFVFFIFISLQSIGQSDIEKRLFNLPDVIFEKIEKPDGFEAAYKLMIKQPLDHTDESKGYFYQKVYLSHNGFDKPSAIITNGYNIDINNINEIVTLIDGNQLNVEHRYFGESMPDSMDYAFLNFKQVTGDLHKIRMLFKNIYSSSWLASGISKGGTTCIFYKYFYPEDVKASVPYVAPLNYEYEEKRIYSFLNSIGTDSCRMSLYELQKSLLVDSETILELLHWYAKGKGLNFSYLSLGEAYEYAVLELPFSFWQYGQNCSKIPSPSDDIATRLDYLLELVGLDFFSDKEMVNYGSHYYQSATEMGYYGYETEPFRGLMKYLPYSPHPHAAFVPNKIKVKWDGTLTNKVAKWIAEKGNNMLYINGALDTWSATAVPPSKKVNSKWFFLEDKHHASARISQMTAAEKKSFVMALEEWMGIDIE